MNEWFNAKIIVPAFQGTYLVSDGISIFSCTFFIDDDEEYFETCDGMKIKPTHWMNLPTPPKILTKREMIIECLSEPLKMYSTRYCENLIDEIMKIVEA